MNLVKSFGAVLGSLAISLILFQGCTSSSTGSSSSGSGSIVRIQVLPATSSMQQSTQNTFKDSNGNNVVLNTFSSTFITVIVRDNNGNLVPGVPVNITCGSGFLGDTPDATNPINSITVNTNSNGQVQVKYTAPFNLLISGTTSATISATSQGNFGSATITITI